MQGVPIFRRPHYLGLVLIGFLSSCGMLFASPGISQAQNDEQVVTYDDDVLPQVFQPFCNSCHSSTLTGADRFGAPLGVDYDTYELAIEGANEILAVAEVVVGSMPPAGPLPQELVDLMLAWQAAGFPESQASVEPTGELTAAAGVSGDQNVPELSRVTLDGSDSRSPDGTLPDTFLWVQTEGPAVLLTEPNSVAPSFIAPDVDTVTRLVFELSVVDAGEIDTTTVAVSVFDVVQPFSEDSGGNSGGCTMNPGGNVDPVLVGLVGFMLVFLGWRHLRRTPRS